MQMCMFFSAWASFIFMKFSMINTLCAENMTVGAISTLCCFLGSSLANGYVFTNSNDVASVIFRIQSALQIIGHILG